MPRALRCLLVLTALVVGGACVTSAGGGPGPAGVRGGATATTRTVAAEILDTSWGDDYVRPQQ
ncbi:hypothetical protein A8W25_00410 [Streptomyces sp. ERV7]|uniref:hypothetical protein n=1 Tax=Streptomyces sp. ERV7 TaxID=1322334 RepID=UPI0007F40977|nr:hypothetical protein [Streptomyces sp. ERV7]OAR26806.1 hypothetical protein A8W25_00410 [Streptomyces sp. ERV7]